MNNTPVTIMASGAWGPGVAVGDGWGDRWGDGVDVGEGLALVLGERDGPGSTLKLGLAPDDSVGVTAGAGLEQPPINQTMRRTIERWPRTPL